ncbi:iron-containing redox enzyme family protein [Phenylobacterium aquaticum]|uniref:iron-containing redox enzyme family protein n=1 Tax=Phenylobacterium aquaticum TaxID=1763816 RepID=UPI001F5E3373|nr:iron-containing redox enzyme family protein [Phenylobacterium aquaticum]MCI3135256.1 iron-containing redox enzyme family protein [Phenylobacterium aquaticum]
MFGGLRLSRLGAFSPQFPDAEALHRGLAHWNHRRLEPALPGPDWEGKITEDARMLRVEGAFIEAFRAEIAPLVAGVPSEPEAFLAWFDALKDSGPGQWDPLFSWLETTAGIEDLKWFLTQEAAGEAGFDDLVALTQVKLPAQPKLELARNYWDEMGRGNAAGMHGPMLDVATRTLGLTPAIDHTLWQSLALANTMTAFATTRRYVYQSVGALGAVELTAPTRVVCVEAGLKRVGAPIETRKYFALHAQLDIEHSKAWNAEAIAPLVRERPDCARHIAEGAIMRLICGEQCFETYRAHLWAHAHPLVYAAE